MLKTVKLYSRVKIRRGRNEKCFILVNSNEVDVSKGRISFESPLGKAYFHRLPAEYSDRPWSEMRRRPAKRDSTATEDGYPVLPWMGRTSLNRKTEEEINVKAPMGVVKYKVVAID